MKTDSHQVLKSNNYMMYRGLHHFWRRGKYEVDTWLATIWDIAPYLYEGANMRNAEAGRPYKRWYKAMMLEELKKKELRRKYFEHQNEEYRNSFILPLYNKLNYYNGVLNQYDWEKMKNESRGKEPVEINLLFYKKRAKPTWKQQLMINFNRAMKLSKIRLFKMEQTTSDLKIYKLKKDILINRKNLTKKKFDTWDDLFDAWAKKNSKPRVIKNYVSSLRVLLKYFTTLKNSIRTKNHEILISIKLLNDLYPPENTKLVPIRCEQILFTPDRHEFSIFRRQLKKLNYDYF